MSNNEDKEEIFDKVIYRINKLEITCEKIDKLDILDNLADNYLETRLELSNLRKENECDCKLLVKALNKLFDKKWSVFGYYYEDFVKCQVISLPFFFNKDNEYWYKIKKEVRDKKYIKMSCTDEIVIAEYQWRKPDEM